MGVFGFERQACVSVLPSGDRIMDFSSAGYESAAAAIPDVSQRVTVNPSSDASDDIQNAVDLVSQMTLVDGHRGAVQLAAGVYDCKKTIHISTSGVVIRGVSGTVIRLSGPPHAAFSVSGELKVSPEGRTTTITDSYVPSGTDSFSVGSTSGLAVGDTIQITRPVTPTWVRFMGMAGLIRSGKDEHWLSGTIETTREIGSIDESRITVTVPLADNYDSHYLNPPGSTVAKVKVAGAISQVGIEHLAIECPPQSITINDAAYSAIRYENAEDSWVRDLDCRDTVGSVNIGGGWRG